MTEIKTYTTMADTVEKVYCTEPTSASDVMAMMNNNGGMWNNPWIYMVWMMMFRNGFFGNGGEDTAANFNSRQIAALQETVNTNHNNDLAMQAIQGNGNALHELAGNLNVGVASLNSAIQTIQAGIGQVGSAVGLTGERVINAIGNGDLNIIQQLKDCCCSNKTLIQQMGYDSQLAAQKLSYENQIQTLNSTNQLNGRIDQLSNGIQTGFAQVGYATAQQTSQIVNAGNTNTQKILDTLNNHWVAETSQALQDAKFEVSQLKQTQYLSNQMNGVSNSGSIWS